MSDPPKHPIDWIDTAKDKSVDHSLLPLSTANPDETIAAELDAIMKSYRERSSAPKPNKDEEKRYEFLRTFEELKVSIIQPAMNQIGKYLEKNGHSYAVIDETTIYSDNPSIRMEIYPGPSDSIQEREFPKIMFIAEPDISEVGIEVQDGMPGRPGLSRGHTIDLQSLTSEYARGQILYLVKRNFSNART